MNYPGILVNGRKSTTKTRGRFEGYISLAGSNNCRLDRQSKHREPLSRGGREKERKRRGTWRFLRGGNAIARPWTLIESRCYPLPFLRDSPLVEDSERQNLQIQSYWRPLPIYTVCSAYWFLVRITSSFYRIRTTDSWRESKVRANDRNPACVRILEADLVERIPEKKKS